MKRPGSKFETQGTTVESGYGFVGVLVGLALICLGIVGTLESMSNIAKRRAAAEWVGEKAQLKKLLLDGTSCAFVEACKADETVEIRSAEARILVKRDRSSQYGPFVVEARCQANKTIEFRIAAFKDGKFGRDPLTGQLLDWDSPEGVLIRGGDLCGVPQFGLGDDPSNSPRVILGKLCRAAQGSCSIPKELSEESGLGKRMCCPDGRDGKKPKCPPGTYELGSYWDRDGDWGLDGRWAVSCK